MPARTSHICTVLSHPALATQFSSVGCHATAKMRLLWPDAPDSDAADDDATPPVLRSSTYADALATPPESSTLSARVS